MDLLNEEFRESIIRNSLELLHDQWIKLGVSFEAERRFDIFSDPEAAIVFSGYFERYDSDIYRVCRVWPGANCEHLNMARLKRMKPKGIRFPASLGLESTPKSMPYTSSKYIGTIDMEAGENLLPRLRLIFGCTTKAEVLFHLLTSGEANSYQIARKRFLNQKAVHTELDKLSRAGVLRERRNGRERLFRVNQSFLFLHSDKREELSVAWFLTAIVFILERCLNDELINYRRLVNASFDNNRRTICDYFMNSGVLINEFETESPQDFYDTIREKYRSFVESLRHNHSKKDMDI